MINAAKALEIILEVTQPVGTEKVPLLDSPGRMLARDIISDQDLPPFNNSSMDGFAVVSSDLRDVTIEHPRVLKIVGESSAGKVFQGKIRPGEAVRVMTGGVIPKSADSVVPIEHVELVSGGSVRFTASVKPGQYVRECGEDIRRGRQS